VNPGIVREGLAERLRTTWQHTGDLEAANLSLNWG